MKDRTRILAFFGIVALFVIVAFKPLNQKKVIIIDAAHGGKDLGATIDGVQEKDIVEAISKKIKAQNQDENIEIFLLREGDHFMELSERVSIINNLNPDLVISLHVNSSKHFVTNGADAYISSKPDFNEKSKVIAEKVLGNITNQSLKKRRLNEAPFYVLKNSNCPVVLLELGFLSNDGDRDYITSEDGQNEIAANILESVK